MIASPQAASAALVSRDCSSPLLQVGMPFTLMKPFLSVSSSTDVSAGGWVPSMVAILPDACSEIGAGVFFDSAFGEKWPSAVNLRLPTCTVTGPSPAALAKPTAVSAIKAQSAAVNVKNLRISLYLSFCSDRFRSRGDETIAWIREEFLGGQITNFCLFVNPAAVTNINPQKSEMERS